MKRKIFSILFALVLVLSFSLVMAVPAAAAPGDVEFKIEGSGTAAWSTEKFQSGSYSVLLTAANPYSASVGVEVIPTPLAAITQLSFSYNHKVNSPAGHVLGPDMVLILQNGGQYYVAGRGGAVASVGAWLQANPIEGTNFAVSSTWFYGSLTGTDIGTFTPIGSGLTFSALQTALSGAMVLYAAVNLDPPGEGSNGSVYVDVITVNNLPYDLEPVEGASQGSGTVPKVEITSSDIQGPYVVGIEKGFSVTTTSDTTLSLVRFNFVATGAVLADIASFKYQAGGTWYAMPLTPVGGNLEGYFGPPGGFVMTAPYNVTTPFKVTFNTAKAYPVTLSLVNMPGKTIIKSVAFSLVVENRPSTIAVTAPSNFSFGVFHIGDNLAASATPGTVTYTPGSGSPTGWQVTAKDANQATTSGHMLKDATHLLSELLIKGAADYSVASTGITYSGTTTDVTGTLPFQAEQVIAGTEAPGAYTITIEFTGTLALP